MLHRVLCCVALVACVTEDEAILDSEVVNADPDFVQVYVNNVENLETPSEQCPGDWRDLVHYMRRQELSPDLFLVQQVSDRAQLDRLLGVLTTQLAGRFEGVIADGDPKPFNSPCGAAKDDQTNAIVYRAGRFERIGAKVTWKAWRQIDGECRRDPTARTLSVMQVFRDKLAGRRVAVVSLHWSTTQGCALKNARELSDRLAEVDADLVIAGGDTNEPDRRGGEFLPWYAALNGDLGGNLGFRDPIFTACRSSVGPTRTCLDRNWTIGSVRRIDFLFARQGDGDRARTSHAHTITFGEADQAARAQTGSDSPFNYSDHRAIRARIHY